MVNLRGFAPPQDPQQIAALAITFDGPALAIPTNRALVARLTQNAAHHPIAAPLLIAQGLADTLVPPAATDAYVDERCAAGQAANVLIGHFLGSGRAQRSLRSHCAQPERLRPRRSAGSGSPGRKASGATSLRSSCSILSLLASLRTICFASAKACGYSGFCLPATECPS
jgi:hypothetical protein